MSKENIDFVILWVDGNDKKWLEEKNKFSAKKIDNSNSDNRYRDWDNLKFWFRAVEKYAAWVNKIHFITYGHLPKWLNTNCPKLNIVYHSQYIPKEYLPTFNSNVIELNLFRIKELSDKFVLFNDDFFLNGYVDETFFFKKNLPVDIFSEDIIMPNSENLSKNLYMNEEILNRYFNKKKFVKQNFKKTYNIKYGPYLLRNLLLYPWSNYSTFKNQHLPQALLKSTIEEIWDKEYTALNRTCMNKFRTTEDITQYLFRDWQLATGMFYPGTYKRGKYYNISNDNKEIVKDILHEKHKMICLNDVDIGVNFEKAKEEINDAFTKKLPQKSSFEI